VSLIRRLIHLFFTCSSEAFKTLFLFWLAATLFAMPFAAAWLFKPAEPPPPVSVSSLDYRYIVDACFAHNGRNCVTEYSPQRPNGVCRCISGNAIFTFETASQANDSYIFSKDY
jgi:hypothetical protein